MASRIPISEPTVKRIALSEPTVRRIDPQEVADALGGERCPERIDHGAGPLTLYALRVELMRRRQSSGGRPGIEGTSFRAKIPVAEQEWQSLEYLAESLSSDGFAPSAGQVASILLSIALRSLDGVPKAAQPLSHAAALAEELAARLGTEKAR